jgi:hypothetical protein
MNLGVHLVPADPGLRTVVQASIRVAEVQLSELITLITRLVAIELSNAGPRRSGMPALFHWRRRQVLHTYSAGCSTLS